MASIWRWLSGWHRGALGRVRVTLNDTQSRSSLVSWAGSARTRREDEAQRRPRRVSENARI